MKCYACGRDITPGKYSAWCPTEERFIKNALDRLDKGGATIYGQMIYLSECTPLAIQRSYSAIYSKLQRMRRERKRSTNS